MLKRYLNSRILKSFSPSKIKHFIPYASIFMAKKNFENNINIVTFNKKYFSETKQNKENEKIREIVEVHSEKDWEYLVTQTKIPVVIDFYANWCGPCKKLTPILEEKARNSKGKWILGKVDIDEFPQIANAIKIKSVPTVILIHGGNLIDNFIGFDENVVNAFFETVYKLISSGFSLEKGDSILQETKHLIEKGNYGQAILNLNGLLNEEIWVEKNGAYTLALLSYAFAKSGNETQSLNTLAELNNKYEKELENNDIKIIINQIQAEFSSNKEKVKGVEELSKKLEADPGNNDLRFEIAEESLKSQDYDTCIRMCLDILKIDRNWQQKKAQKFLLEVFQKLGSTNPKVIDGRKALQKILY